MTKSNVKLIENKYLKTIIFIMHYKLENNTRHQTINYNTILAWSKFEYQFKKNWPLLGDLWTHFEI